MTNFVFLLCNKGLLLFKTLNKECKLENAILLFGGNAVLYIVDVFI